MARTLARLAAALGVTVTCVAVPTTAAHAGACVEKDTFNYSPPLGLATTSGTMSGTHTNSPCVFSSSSSGAIGTTYTGNCLAALFGANTVSAIVLGGTVHVMFDAGAVKTKVMVMVPNGVCPTYGATGYGLWVDNS